MKVKYIKVEGGYAFEVWSSNGRLLATSKVFRRRIDAEKAFVTLRDGLAGATVTKEEGP